MESHSDTETILSCFEKFGVERTIQKAVGAFAIGAGSYCEKSLILARDRLGEKPHITDGMEDVFFASELKALRVHPNFAPEKNRHALWLFFRYNCIPTPLLYLSGHLQTLARSTLMLKKGQRIFAHGSSTLLLGIISQRGCILLRYWSLSNVAKMGQVRNFFRFRE